MPLRYLLEGLVLLTRVPDKGVEKPQDDLHGQSVPKGLQGHPGTTRNLTSPKSYLNIFIGCTTLKGGLAYLWGLNLGIQFAASRILRQTIGALWVGGV